MTQEYNNKSEHFLFQSQPHLEGENHANWLVKLIRKEIKEASQIQADIENRKKIRENRVKFWGAVALSLSLILSTFAVFDRFDSIVDKFTVEGTQ